jgi:hypothetical protein
MNKKTSHKQVLIEVNEGNKKIIVKIDENIKNIILILNKFNGLETIESCQGDENNPAWLCFKYKYWQHPYQNLVDFVFGFLGPYLIERVGDSIIINIYATSSGSFLAELGIRPGTIKMVELAMEDAFQLFENKK